MDTKSTKGIILSIIIPSYNTPVKFIEEAIESIEKQASDNLEIIIVDDGSEASFHLILVEIAGRYDNVTLITTENHGVSHARNIGVLAAKGKYISFLDADDILDPYFFRDSLLILTKYQPELVLGGTKSFEENITENNYRTSSFGVLRCNEKDRFNLLKYHIDYNFDFPQLDFCDDSHIGRGQIGARLIRRDVMLSHLFNTNIGYGEDLLWNIQLMQDCKDVLISNAQWYWYRNNSNSASRSYNSHFYEDMAILLDELERMLDLNNDALFVAFVDKVYSCIYICWKYYLSDKRIDNQNKRHIEKIAMHEKPWIYLKDKRFKKLCSRKMRLFSFLHDNNLLFASFRVRSIFDGIKGSISGKNN